MGAKTQLVLSMAAALVLRFQYPDFDVTANPDLKSKQYPTEIEAETSVKHLGHFHPIAVHFPIPFAFGTLLAELLFVRTRRSSFARGSRLMLYPGL